MVLIFSVLFHRLCVCVHVWKNKCFVNCKILFAHVGLLYVRTTVLQIKNTHSVSSILQPACPLAALLSHQRITAGAGQQQWLVLCNRFAFSHALVCDLFNRIVQMENEQDPGLHNVPPLLCIPDNQRDVRRSNHFLSCICLSQSHCCSQWTWIRKPCRKLPYFLLH